MDSQTLKQYITYTFIALLVVFIIIWSKPANTYPPRAIFLPSNAKVQSNHSVNNVQIITTRPSSFTTVGSINLEQHVTRQSQDAEKKILTLVAHMAGKNGANAVYITGFAFEPAAPGEPSGMAKYVLQAKAIKTSPSNG